MAAALLRLNQQLQEIGSSLDGIDFATDNGYLSPTVAKAVDSCGLVFTTRFKSTQKLTTLDGEPIVIKELLSDLIQHHPIRMDSRAETQGYYWRKDVVHPYLGQGTLVIQRRKVRSGGFQYHYHFTQHHNAKAITVLQLAKRRWPIEVFFRESKQQLGMGHWPLSKMGFYAGSYCYSRIAILPVMQSTKSDAMAEISENRWCTQASIPPRFHRNLSISISVKCHR